MKQTNAKKLLSFILCMVLIAAMALIASGCNANKNDPADTEARENGGKKHNNVRDDHITPPR